MNGPALELDAIERRFKRAINRDLRLFGGFDYTAEQLERMTLGRLLRLRRRVITGLMTEAPTGARHVA